jgi:hypothetical protein
MRMLGSLPIQEGLPDALVATTAPYGNRPHSITTGELRFRYKAHTKTSAVKPAIRM